MRAPLVTLGAALLHPAEAAPHTLPTAGLALTLEGPLRVRAGERDHSAGAFALGSDRLHAGAATGVHAIVLVDELAPVGAAFAATHPSIHGAPTWLRTLHREVVHHAHELERPGVLVALIDELLHRAAAREDWRRPPRHPRVRAALAVIEDAVRAGAPLPRPLVRGISPAHLRAVFRRDLGRTISAHARRRRLLVAMAAIGGGASATRATHDAGFADAAHLSRTVRTAFGTTLRELRAGTLLVA